MASNKLTHGQRVLVDIKDPNYGYVATHIEGGPVDWYGEECYYVPINIMVKVPRHKIWDFDTLADNCRGKINDTQD